MNGWLGKACRVSLGHGNFELAGPAEALAFNPFVFVADLDGGDVAACFVETAEEDGYVCDLDGFEDRRVLVSVISTG